MSRQAITYGVVMAVAVFLVGWVTGMGGSLLPNLVFSLAMGVLASVLYVVASRLSGKTRSGSDQ